MPTVRTGLLAIALAVVLVAARAPVAAAQTASDRTTFSDASGAIWGVAVLETSVVLGAGIIASGDACQSWGCGILMMLIAGVGLVAGLVTGIATQVAGTPPDVPFVLHEAIWGGVGGLVLGEGIAKATDARPGVEVGLAVGGALLFGGAIATYSVVSRDTLHRDPETTWATHLLAWGPIALASFSMYLFRDIDAPPGLLALAVAILATQGLSVLAVELEASDAPAGTVAPLISYGMPF